MGVTSLAEVCASDKGANPQIHMHAHICICTHVHTCKHTCTHAQLTQVWQWLAHLLSRQSWELNGPPRWEVGSLGLQTCMHTRAYTHVCTHMCT